MKALHTMDCCLPVRSCLIQYYFLVQQHAQGLRLASEVDASPLGSFIGVQLEADRAFLRAEAR